MGTLPVALFNNGHTYFTQRLPELINVNPYAMHATFQYDGTPGKRNRMREANQWLGDRDDPSYFDQKFLSYTPRVLSDVDLQEFAQRGYPSPDGAFETLKQGEHVVLEHMRLVQHQIAQLYEAVAIAKSGESGDFAAILLRVGSRLVSPRRSLPGFHARLAIHLPW